MKIKKTSYFFISGGVLFTLLIINQLYGYYYINAVTAEFRGEATSDLAQMQKELSPEKNKEEPFSKVGATTSLTQAAGLADFSASASGNDPANTPATSDVAIALKQAESEIAKLVKQLRDTESEHSVLESALVRCTKIEHMGDRLDCYDVAMHPQKQIDGINKDRAWAIRKNISPIDDSTSLSFTASARETFKSSGYDAMRPVFSITCSADSSNVMFSTGQYLSKGSYYFETRIGKNKSRSLAWRVDDRGRSAYLEMQTKDFIKQLLVSDRLAIQIGTPKESATFLTFDLTGLASENQDLQTFCGVSI